ncbi:hypothetical protein [Sphingomonas sp. VNH70]|uniref:hypothetical protein n=1 Tax=Sphingomonas silueang TaxID=3156617 RepID=UPI0032B48D11
MTPVRTGIVVALLLAAVPVGPAVACSVRSGYKVPTALDLAATADAIVIARIDGERKGPGEYDGTVLATPVAVLKGSTAPRRIELPDAFLAKGGEGAERSDPRELRAPHPGALIGGCVRYRFPRGTRVLLFLKRDAGGHLVPYRSAFARDAEDVDGPDSLWAKTVREYVAIAASRARAPAMRQRIAALRARGGADDIAIASDMATELSRSR